MTVGGEVLLFPLFFSTPPAPRFSSLPHSPSLPQGNASEEAASRVLLPFFVEGERKVGKGKEGGKHGV